MTGLMTNDPHQDTLVSSTIVLLVDLVLAREPMQCLLQQQIKSIANSYSKHKTENKEKNHIKTIESESQRTTSVDMDCQKYISFIVLSTRYHMQLCQVSSNTKWPQMENVLLFLQGRSLSLMQENLENIILCCAIRLILYFTNYNGCFTDSMFAFQSWGHCLQGAHGGKLTVNLLISHQFMTHDPLKHSDFNEFRG